MDYLVSIIRTSPLLIHFSFYNADHDGGTIYVPRPLGPLGYFISLTISDAGNELVYETFKPAMRSYK